MKKEKINSNPPAFPSTKPAQNIGMTLRDYFAAQAISSVEGSMDGFTIQDLCDALSINLEDYDPKTHWAAFFADRTYALADAMLERRES